MTTSHSENTTSSDEVLESHRAFVREINDRFGRVYGIGGLFSLLCAAIVIAVSASLGVILHPLPWIVSLTVWLLALLYVRKRVLAKRKVLLERVLRYCDANHLSLEAMRHYYAEDGFYTFFLALIETPEASS